MTFRDKVQKECPEAINERALGGVTGCPCHYGYEKDQPMLCSIFSDGMLTCTNCWNREMPELENGGREEMTIGEMVRATGNVKQNTETVVDGIMIIADHYGIENQKKKLVEEMGELIQAVCKDDLPGIIEECADVNIMLHQIAYLLGISKNVCWAMEQKVERQLERIRKEGEG